MFFGGRFHTKEEREKIRENKRKEREVRGYSYDAVNRMKSKEPNANWKMRGSSE